MEIKALASDYLKHLQSIGRAFYTRKNCKSCLRDFARFLENEQVHAVEDLTQEVLEEYQQDLAFRISNRGSLLNQRSQEKLLLTALSFARYLKEKDYLVSDPGEHIKRPRQARRLPKIILSPAEVRKLLKTPDTQTPLGYRNRVMLEILYDTAMRRSELSNLKINDLDLQSGYAVIRAGKGDKDRVVPLSKRVCELVQNYLLFIRPTLLQSAEDQGHLILNYTGHSMDPNSVWRTVHNCVRESGIKKNISTHTFRHTCATHMLRNGAPIRHVQEMLGHASLESTQLYTHVTINDLKAVHSKYHPSERIVKGETSNVKGDKT
jgi:integrase/recombinase XerD